MTYLKDKHEFVYHPHTCIYIYQNICTNTYVPPVYLYKHVLVYLHTHEVSPTGLYIINAHRKTFAESKGQTTSKRLIGITLSQNALQQYMNQMLGVAILLRPICIRPYTRNPEV